MSIWGVVQRDSEGIGDPVEWDALGIAVSNV